MRRARKRRKNRKHREKIPVNRGRRYEYEAFLTNGRQFIVYEINELEVRKRMQRIIDAEEDPDLVKIRSIRKVEYD